MCKLITFAIAAYNSEKFLRKCLDSFLLEDNMQELYNRKIEVLVVNDGSTDGTLIIAEEYQKKYPELYKVLSKENGGHGSVINKAVKTASGKYFKVIDADDWIETGNLTAYVDALERTDADVVLTHYKTFDVQSKEIVRWNTFLRDYNRMYSLKDVEADWKSMDRCLTFHGITYNTEFYRLKGTKLEEKVFYEDQQYAVIPCCYAGDIKALDLCLYVYRIGDQEQSVSEKNQYLRRGHMKKVALEMCQYLKKHELKAEALFYYEEKLSRFFLSYLLTVLLVSPDKKKGRLEGRGMNRVLKREYGSIYAKIRKRYLVLLMLNYLHIPNTTYQRIIRSRIYNAIRKNRELQTESE